jgi:hypothetical protein
MAALEKQRRLAELLIQKTANGEIDWKETAEATVFQVSFATTTLQISTRWNQEAGEPDYLVSLLNEVGTVVDSFSDNDLQDKLTPPGTWFRRMEGLFHSARRSALGSDKILDDILSELGDVPF